MQKGSLVSKRSLKAPIFWAKGYRELIDLLAKHNNDLDVFGNGEDALEVQSAARRLNLNLNFLKGKDRADDSLHG